MCSVEALHSIINFPDPVVMIILFVKLAVNWGKKKPTSKHAHN